MSWSFRFGYGIAVSLVVAALLGLESVQAHPIVPAYERLVQGNDVDAVQAGLLLISELNCVACHAADGQAVSAKQPPRLDDVGHRIRPEFLREFLRRPNEVDAGTTMPHVLNTENGEELSDRVESLVHYLASTSALAESAPVAAGVNRGRQLFHTVGCLACHDSPLKPDPKRPTSVPLDAVARKYALPGLAKFLQDPLHVRPSGRMPSMNLTPEEARDLACFLLRDLQIPTSMTFQYYEGHWEKLPDFSRLAPKSTGGAASFDVEVGAADHFAVRFQGKFKVDEDGQYRFFLSSDDGSRLLIDGREVLVNDGIHATTEENTKVSLTAGEHDFAVEYFEGAGEQVLKVEYQGGKTKRQSLEYALVAPMQESSAERFVADPKLAARGKEVFASAGCIACHSIGEQRLSAPRGVPKLLELREGGCLENKVQPGIPYYNLNDQQRRSITAALKTLEKHRPTPESRVQQMMLAMNCVACHERDGLGGVETSRNADFRSTQPEMGDEGRLPPSLTGVGRKLKPRWLKQIFETAPKDRPYMLTRMPTFGVANASQLTDDLIETDRRSPPMEAATLIGTIAEPERKLKAIGRHLVGDKGMSCIKCHVWGNVKATGIQAINLTSMTRRLDYDWFHQYMLDPQRYRPGTRMPAAWPGGQSPFANILDGHASQQIESIWRFLGDGNNATMPSGIGEQVIEVVVENEPVIYRNFLDVAGARGIAVGYPEKMSVAFDANDCRLALIWQGAFIDASMHWLGRGQGFQRPLGDNVLELIAGIPVATLESLNAAWPTPDSFERPVRFRGYQLDSQRRPVFKYRWEDLNFEDHVTPVVDGNSQRLRRVIRVKGTPTSNAWFRIIVAKEIQQLTDGEYRIDGDWRLQVQAEGLVTRQSADKQELLAPLQTRQSDQTITLEYVW